MYWLRACVDMDNATDAARSGQHENVTGYNEYDPIVTIPFNKDSLNFVSYKPCLNILFLLRVENIALFTIFSIISIRILLIKHFMYTSSINKHLNQSLNVFNSN